MWVTRWCVINMCSISYSNLSIQPSFSFRITSIRRSTHLVAECDLYLVPFLRTISDSAAVVTPPMALAVKIRLTSLLLLYLFCSYFSPPVWLTLSAFNLPLTSWSMFNISSWTVSDGTLLALYWYVLLSSICSWFCDTIAYKNFAWTTFTSSKNWATSMLAW